MMVRASFLALETRFPKKWEGSNCFGMIFYFRFWEGDRMGKENRLRQMGESA